MNDERPIEKLLRRYAKKRRDEAGTPLELHPATRRLLQGEVSRQFPKAGAERKNSSAEWFAAFRRRWVYATAALTVGLIAGVILVTTNKKPRVVAQQHDLELAKNEIAPAAVGGKEVALRERAVDASRRLATPTPAAAPVPELSLNQPAPAANTAPDNDGLKRDLPQALALNAGTERLRVVKDESATASPSALPRDTEQITLAKKTTAKKAPQPAATPEEYANAARADQLSAQRLAAKPVTPLPSSAVAGESQPAEVAGPAEFRRFADSSVGRDSKLTPTAAEPPGAPAGATVAFESRAASAPRARGGSLERDRMPAVSQAFANRAPLARTEKAAQATPPSSVLANFKVEQTGDRLRVIDSDGSAYLGEMNAAPASFGGANKDQQMFKSGGKLAERPAFAVPVSTEQSAQNYFYRVAGTNRTLNQQVVFTWNFVALTNAVTQSKMKVVGGVLNQNGLGASQQFPALLQNSAINGRAQINAAKEIEINAVPVTPSR